MSTCTPTLWAKYAGPGGWNDPDMLEVGRCKLDPGLKVPWFQKFNLRPK